ncbi:hypothetical protein DYB25_007617 [Aphanomyces astaci]|uniref:Amino acid transporter transmembrane domain-containing protein n=2 Tax=Aphanomyces astaci TaxID=112090 RepID=A0A397BR08_APHAT|nr:hypothetical protein DYB25_007617 [Aphanomyces astaci]
MSHQLFRSTYSPTPRLFRTKSSRGSHLQYHCQFCHATTMSNPFLTVEDLKLSFSLFCCVYGIGTLSMPGNYAKVGYGWATAALVFMAAVNIYGTLCISKVLLVAPKSVRTYSDLGEFCLGPVGRWLVLITHMLTCILVPIAFLVLGGIICTIMFPDSYEAETWIILMGLSLLPVCLIPTLKEGAFAAAAGALGTIIADFVALYLLVDNMSPIPSGVSTPSPDVNFDQIASVFGSLALAYGAGIVIPSLQREHSQPERMPRVIFFTLGMISVLFMAVAISGVSVVGCQIPGNLLFSIAGAPTKLGFTANRGGVILANLFMQLHVTIAFGIIINPAFYILERLLLGLHRHLDTIQEIEGGDFQANDTPNAEDKTIETSLNKHDSDEHDLDSKTYRQPGVYPKVAALRTVVISGTVAVACLWKDRLLDLVDFTGASCIAMCCMVLPMVFYLKHFGNKVGKLEKVWAVFAIAMSLFLGGYETYQKGKPLFNPPAAAEGPVAWDAVKFNFCPPESSYARIVYTNVSYHANFNSPSSL